MIDISIKLIETAKNYIIKEDIQKLSTCLNSLELIKNISNQNIQDKIKTIEINITSSFDVIISNIQILIG